MFLCILLSTLGVNADEHFLGAPTEFLSTAGRLLSDHCTDIHIGCLNCFDPVNGPCIVCDTSLGYAAAPVADECVCAATHFLDNDACVECSAALPGCLECDDLGENCDVCDWEAGYETDSVGGCQCRQSFYETAEGCVPCSTIPGCLFCDGPDACTQCETDEFFVEESGTCACMLSFVLVDDACVQCNTQLSGCLTCSSSSTCTLCDEFSHFELTTEFTCVCEPGYYLEDFNDDDPSNDECMECDSVCSTCDADDHCLSCNADANFTEVPAEDGSCTCEPGFYLNTSNTADLDDDECVECSMICVTCEDSNSCSLCDADQDFVSGPLEDGSCSCNEGWYLETQGNEVIDDDSCEQCSAICETCEAANSCLTCNRTHFETIPDNEGHCQCVPGYYLADQGTDLIEDDVCEECSAVCVLCDSATTCVTCNTTVHFNELATEGLCSCIDGFYLDNAETADVSDDQCLECSLECATCSDESTCLTCNAELHYEDADEAEGVDCQCEEHYVELVAGGCIGSFEDLDYSITANFDSVNQACGSVTIILTGDELEGVPDSDLSFSWTVASLDADVDAVLAPLIASQETREITFDSGDAPTGTLTFTLTVTSINGVEFTAEFTVYIINDGVLVLTVTPESAEITPLDSVTFTANVTNPCGNPVEFEWQYQDPSLLSRRLEHSEPGDVISNDGESASTLTVNEFDLDPCDTYVYVVTATDGILPAVFQSVEITVNPAPLEASINEEAGIISSTQDLVLTVASDYDAALLGHSYLWACTLEDDTDCVDADGNILVDSEFEATLVISATDLEVDMAFTITLTVSDCDDNNASASFDFKVVQGCDPDMELVNPGQDYRLNSTVPSDTSLISWLQLLGPSLFPDGETFSTTLDEENQGEKWEHRDKEPTWEDLGDWDDWDWDDWGFWRESDDDEDREDTDDWHDNRGGQGNGRYNSRRGNRRDRREDSDDDDDQSDKPRTLSFVVPAEVMLPGECYSVALVYETENTTEHIVFTWATDSLGCEGIELTAVSWPWAYASLEGCVGSSSDTMTYNFAAVIDGTQEVLVSNSEVNGTFVNLDNDDLTSIIGEVCQESECRSYEFTVATTRRRLQFELAEEY